MNKKIFGHSSKHLCSGSECKIDIDIKNLEERVEKSFIPSSIKSETLVNMETISADAHMLQNDKLSLGRRKRITKALALRMKALKSELQNLDNADLDLSHDKNEIGNEEEENDDEFSSSVGHSKNNVLTSSVNHPCSGSECKVNEDIRQLEERVEKVSKPGLIKSEILANIKGISSDAHKLHDDKLPNARRDEIKQALSLRMKALKTEIQTLDNDDLKEVSHDKKEIGNELEDNDDNEFSSSVGHFLTKKFQKSRTSNKYTSGHSSKHLKEDKGMKKLEEHVEKSADHSSLITKFDKDIKNVEEKIQEQHLSKSIISNLEKIKSDVHLMSKVEKKKQGSLKKAIQHRMNAFHSQIESESPSNDSLGDSVTSLEEAISHVHPKPGLKKQMEENIRAIKKDKERLKSASTGKKSDLVKAIKFRMQALRSEFDIAKKA